MLAAAPAQAHVIELFGQLRFGGATGKGVAGDQEDQDFFARSAGPTYGGILGIEVLGVQAWVEHDQFTDFKSVDGTWTAFMLGTDITIGLDDDGPKNPAKLFANLGIGVGFGLGTGKQIEPPLDNAQISDKGFLIQGKAGIEYHFSDAVALGVQVPVTWGYMFKNNVPANESGNSYQSTSVMGLAYLPVQVRLELITRAEPAPARSRGFDGQARTKPSVRPSCYPRLERATKGSHTLGGGALISVERCAFLSLHLERRMV